MALINDTDLLMLEPTLFTDANAAALSLASAKDAVINDLMLSSAAATFLSLNIGPGYVVIVGDEPLEIYDAPGETSLMVTRRREPGTPPIGPGDGSGLTYTIYTFSQLSDASEQHLIRALGLDAMHPSQPLTTANVLNYAEFASLVALRTIARAFAHAAALAPNDESLRDRAELYERLEIEMRHHLVAAIDSNGDGIVDERRRLSVGTWVRV